MVLEKFIEGTTNQDLPLLKSLLHQDMLFVQETKLETKARWMKDTKEFKMVCLRHCLNEINGSLKKHERLKEKS